MDPATDSASPFADAPPIRPSDQPSTEVRQVTPDFFSTMGMPVQRGRGIASSDQPGNDQGARRESDARQAILPERGRRRSIDQSRLGRGYERRIATDRGRGRRRAQCRAGGRARAHRVRAHHAGTVFEPVDSRSHERRAVIAGRTAASDRARPRPRSSRLLGSNDGGTRRELGGRQKFYATLIAIFAGVALVLSPLWGSTA